MGHAATSMVRTVDSTGATVDHAHAVNGAEQLGSSHNGRKALQRGGHRLEAIDADLAKLAPPKLTLKDVLDRLRDRMLEQRAKGVTVAQMHEVLKAGGIEIGERSLKTFLDKGELPGRKAKAAAQAAMAEEGGGPF